MRKNWKLIRREIRSKFREAAASLAGRHSALFSTKILHFPVGHVLQKPERILIVKSDKIGDFTLSLPAIDLLRKSFPSARLELLCQVWNQELAHKSQLFDAVWVCSARPSLGQARHALGEGVLSPYDLAIDLRIEDDQRDYLRNVNAAVKAAIRGKRSKKEFDIELPCPRKAPWDAQAEDVHAAVLMLKLSQEVVRTYFECSGIGEILARKPIPGQSVPSLLSSIPSAKQKLLVGINCCSGAETRDWPIERFVDVARTLIAERNAFCVLIGGPDDKSRHRAFLSQLPSDFVHDLTGEVRLSELPEVLAELGLYIGNDTGTTHMAAGLGVPTVCIYSGVTSIGRFAARGPRSATVVRGTPCSPCGVSSLGNCIGNHECMRGIDTPTVMQAVEIVLR